MAKATLGLIVGNRGFFADNLVKDGRKVMLKLLKELDIDVVTLDEKATKLGAVETKLTIALHKVVLDLCVAHVFAHQIQHFTPKLQGNQCVGISQ